MRGYATAKTLRYPFESVGSYVSYVILSAGTTNLKRGLTVPRARHYTAPPSRLDGSPERLLASSCSHILKISKRGGTPRKSGLRD
jgi:hypothetical protein